MKYKKTVFLLLTFSALILYLFFSSTIIVEPGSVVIINELKIDKDSISLTSRPLINGKNRSKIFFKQPVIPGTGIGSVDEVYSFKDPYSFKTSFALYTLDQLTGNNEDKNKVRAYTISGKIGEIKNWDNFLNKLDLQEINDRQTPYSKKYENRIEVIADQLKFLLRTQTPAQYYPYGSGTDEEIMNLGQKISYLQQELVSRRNFLVALQDQYNFESSEIVRQYLLNNAPWYWVFGIDTYEDLINQSVNLREYEQSIFSKIISRKGAANKYTANEEYLTLINMSGKMNYYEENMIQNQKTFQSLDQFKKQIYRENSQIDLRMGESLISGFSNYLNNNNMRLIDITSENIPTTLAQYIDEDLFSKLIEAINYEKLKLNIDYIGSYKEQILKTYDYSEADQEEAEKTFQFLLEKYDELLEKEHWENYLTSVNNEVNSYLNENPFIRIPKEKVQILTNYKLYSYYLRNIEPSLKRHEIVQGHKLFPIMENLSANTEIFISDRNQVKQIISSWLQDENADFLKVGASLISYNWQMDKTQNTINNLHDYKKRELEPYLVFESRNHDLYESETLWNAAIDNVLNGADLSEERPYYFHPVDNYETISTIAEKYDVNPFDVFYENRFSLLFTDSKKRAELNSSMDYKGFDELFMSSKDSALQTNQNLYIPAEQLYSDKWISLNETKKSKRDDYIDQYVFSNLEKMLPGAFEVFIRNTDYIQNLEHEYGIEFESLSFHFENKNFFSNPGTGEIDNDFIDLYYQKTLR